MLIILDRDGVINRDLPRGVCARAEFVLLPRALEAIAALHRAGHRVVVATNQSAIGKGWMTQSELEAIHDDLLRRVLEAGGEIARIYAATEAPDTPSARRKPAPGMLLEAMADTGFAAADTLFIGDALTDALAAEQAGIRFILVRTGKGRASEAALLPETQTPHAICDDLWEAVQVVLAMPGMPR